MSTLQVAHIDAVDEVDDRHRHRRRRRAADRDALRDALPIILSVLPFGMIVGVSTAQSALVPWWTAPIAAPLLFAGSAHLAAITLLDAGAGLTAAVATAAIVNARMTIYGAALEPRFADAPTWFRRLGVHFIVDQTYALTVTRAPAAEDFRRYWLTLGSVLVAGWTAAVTAGVVLGPAISAGSALHLAAPIGFIGLLMPHLATRAGRTAAVVGGAVAAAAAPVPNGGGLLVAVVAGILPALLGGERSS